MELVIDANIIISALISPEGKTRDLLFSDCLKLFAPEFLLEELKKHTKEITAKSGLSEDDFNFALSLISSRIEFIPFEKFKLFIQKAKEVCIDPNDVEYFALSLSKNVPLWSNDKALKKQSVVRVVNTKELLESIS